MTDNQTDHDIDGGHVGHDPGQVRVQVEVRLLVACDQVFLDLRRFGRICSFSKILWADLWLGYSCGTGRCIGAISKAGGGPLGLIICIAHLGG